MLSVTESLTLYFKSVILLTDMWLALVGCANQIYHVSNRSRSRNRDVLDYNYNVRRKRSCSDCVRFASVNATSAALYLLYSFCACARVRPTRDQSEHCQCHLTASSHVTYSVTPFNDINQPAPLMSIVQKN